MTQIDTVEKLKASIIDSVYAVMVFLAIPTLAASIARMKITGWLMIYNYQLIMVFSLAIILVFRKKINTINKTLLMDLFLTVIVAMGSWKFGFLGSAKLLCIPLVIITGLLINRKAGYILFGLHLILLSLIAYLYTSGILTYSFNLDNYVQKNSVWVTQLLLFSAITLGLSVIINKFDNAYKAILASLKTQEDNYKQLFEQAADGYAISDSKGKILMTNKSFCNITGYEKNEVVGLSFREFFKEEVLKEKPLRFDLLKKGEVVFTERKALCKSGKGIFVEMRTNMLIDKRLQIVIRNVSERIQSELEIKKQQQFIEKILNTAPTLTYVYDIEENKHVFINEAGIKNFGYEREYFEGLGSKLFSKLVHPSDLQKTIDHHQNLMKIGDGEIREIEYRFMNKEGDYKILHSWDTVFMRKETGDVKQIAGSAIDITSQKRTEKKMKDSELKYKTLFDNVNDAIFLMGGGKMVDCNEYALHIFKCEKEELLSLHPSEISPEFQPGGSLSSELIAKNIEATFAGKIQTFEWKHKRVTGEIFDSEVSLNKVELNNENYILAIVRDLTEKKQLERNLFLSSMKAEEDERGRLARDLHDGLGPLLSTSKIYVHNISRLKGIDEENEHIKKLENTIDEALVGIKEISNNISPHILRNFGLKHAISSFIEKLNLTPGISIEHDFEKINKYNEGTEITLYRILTELFTNTLKHALANKIQISIKEEGQSLKMEYTDNGKGLNYEEELTKKSGFGLMNMQSRIHSLSGNMAIVSEPGKGMTVKIELPIEIIPE